jgi:hypothetical protein
MHSSGGLHFLVLEEKTIKTTTETKKEKRRIKHGINK